MPRSIYARPPVKEVILDVQFEGAADKESLRGLGAIEGEFLTRPEHIAEMSIVGSMGATGGFQYRQQPIGWEWKGSNPDYSLRVTAQQATLHNSRSRPWPQGEYEGWESVFERFLSCHAFLAETFEQVPIRRAGLRYVNLLAIPQAADLAELLHQVPEPPPGTDGLVSFTWHQTWGNLEMAPSLAAGIRIGTVQVPEGAVPEPSVGLVMDFDLFNLLPGDAPSWEQLPDWFKTAHSAENALFESHITEALRETFS